MGFLKKIIGTLFGSSDQEIRDRDGIYLYVKCDTCGAPIRVRADKHHDLQRDYDTGEYVLNKEIMDGSCFSLIHATVHFDPGYHIIDQDIEGGEFITWETYQALTAPTESEETDTDTSSE